MRQAPGGIPSDSAVHRPLPVVLAAACELDHHGLGAMMRGHVDQVRLARHADRAAVDVVMMDPTGVGPMAATVIDRVRASSPAARLVAWCPEPHRPAQVLDLGFDAYMSKKLCVTATVKALTRIAAQPIPEGTHAGPSNETAPMMSAVLAPLVFLASDESLAPSGTAFPPGKGLSPREIDVLRHITRGLMNAEIGRDLHLTNNTVKSYVRSAYTKIGVSTRAQAVRWCMEHPDALITPISLGPRTL